MPEPLGFNLTLDEAANEARIRECLTIAAIPDFGGRVHYVDVVTRLALFNAFVERLHVSAARACWRAGRAAAPRAAAAARPSPRTALTASLVRCRLSLAAQADYTNIGAKRQFNAKVMAKVQGEFEMRYDCTFPTLRELPAQTGTSADRVEEILAYTRRHAQPLDVQVILRREAERAALLRDALPPSPSPSPSSSPCAPPLSAVPRSPQHSRVEPYHYAAD